MPDVRRKIVNVTSFGCCRAEALNSLFGQMYDADGTGSNALLRRLGISEALKWYQDKTRITTNNNMTLCLQVMHYLALHKRFGVLILVKRE